MLRLIIADDEKIIRETINDIIDWKSIGIEVIGLCKNGIEAYNMIIDEYPDIVLTDIKMPGLSGLELICRLKEVDNSPEFVILSGYGEFEYAKEAMQCGVKYYLLKPCNETRIIEVMKNVAQDCYHKRAYQDMKNEQQQLTNNLKKNILRNIIVEGLSNDADFKNLISQYGRFFDFSKSSYELYYFYFLEESNLNECLSKLYDYGSKHSPGIPIHVIYVKNTLLVFFQSYSLNYGDFDACINTISFEQQKVSLQIERTSYDHLEGLLYHIIEKLKRYDMIYIMNGLHRIPTCNYNVLFHNVEMLSNKISHAQAKDKYRYMMELKSLIESVEDPEFLKSLITNFLLKLPNLSDFSMSPVDITELLLEISELTEANEIKDILFRRFEDILKISSNTVKHKDYIESLMSYVEDNLSNPNLSLKWIVENHLYMNVDYVSKQFVKETGDKFSTFLTNLRIKRAKELLLTSEIDKIYTVAQEVGCGNNPHYFSQIFKKNMNMTPTDYIKKMNGEM